MKIHRFVLFMGLMAALSFSAAARGQETHPRSPQLPMTHMSGLLSLVETIPVPTEGYMDHLAADVKGQRLFIAGEAARVSWS